MRKSLWLSTVVVVFYLLLLPDPSAFSWYGETHLAIAKAAHDKKWSNAAGADIAKEKAGLLEGRNHYYNNYRNVKVTVRLVLDQVSRYNDPGDEEGHLYGAIIASLRDYVSSKQSNKYSLYHLAYCAHYIGDLSQPQHNVPRDEFNKAHHDANESLVDNDILGRIGNIEKKKYRIILRAGHFEEDLAGEIARIANITRKLDKKLRRQNRLMNTEEIYRQLGHSASLLEAVLNYFRL